MIKANFPSRISFAVGSQVDSRTILDATGADRLLGKGDMLYKPIDLSQPVRVQGAFLGEEEIETIVEFWKHVGAPPLLQLDVDETGDDDQFSMPGYSRRQWRRFVHAGFNDGEEPEDVVDLIVAKAIADWIPAGGSVDGRVGGCGHRRSG